MASRRLMSLKKLLLGLLIVILAARSSVIAGPYATEIISYTEGTNAQIDYNDPNTALGAPSLSIPAWPSGVQDVTMFASAWMTEQIVSIGAGGSLVVKFDHQVTDDLLNPFGFDLLIFSNSMFWDSDWPNGIADGIASEPAMISVSQDGFDWFDISDVFADDLFPTQAYTDTSTAQGADGSILSDFTKPVNPNIDWIGKTYSELLSLYNGSGGGTGVDISGTGLDWIQYVKIHQDVTDMWSAEIDAFADVAAVPASTLLMQVIEDVNAAITSKKEAIETIEQALAKERTAKKVLNTLLNNCELDDLGPKDIIKARQKIHSAIICQILSKYRLRKSVNKLEGALAILTGELEQQDWPDGEDEIRRSDINGDGVIDSKDFAILTQHWLKKYEIN